MSNQDKPQIIEHIIYPYTPITKEIFLKEVSTIRKNIFIGNIKITTHEVSKDLKKFLESKGFTFSDESITHLGGRDKVFGVKISVSKSYQGNEIKELLITIPAKTPMELSKKVDALISGVKSITDVQYSHSTADKFVRC